MTRTVRRTPTFDAMEGRLLLSAGRPHAPHHPHRAAMFHRAEAQVTHIMLNGVVSGIPNGTVGQDGIHVSAFPMTGKVRTLNHVSASLALTDTVIAPGHQPDLSNATLTLADRKGSVQIKTAAGPSNRYIFIVTGGTGPFASAYGSGILAIRYNQGLHEYQIGIKSAKH